MKTIFIDEFDLDTNEFEKEATLLSTVRHPNIIAFYGVALSDQSKFMVTEFLHGGNLDKLIYNCKIKKCTISLKHKMQLLRNVASGISYLHNDREKVIIHRDLKPGMFVFYIYGIFV